MRHSRPGTCLPLDITDWTSIPMTGTRMRRPKHVNVVREPGELGFGAGAFKSVSGSSITGSPREHGCTFDELLVLFLHHFHHPRAVRRQNRHLAAVPGQFNSSVLWEPPGFDGEPRRDVNQDEFALLLTQFPDRQGP